MSTDIISTAVKALVNGTSSGKFTAPKAYPTLRGVMTWSINWDTTNNYTWAKSMSSLMDSLEKHEQPTTKQAITVAPTTKTPVTEAPTVAPTTKNETTAAGQPELKPTEVIGLTIQEQKAGKVTYAWGQTQEQIAYYMNNAKIIREGLAAAGFSASGGVNAPYIWLKTPDKMTSWEFFDYLLDKANVVGTPGSGFGPSGEGYFRLTSFGSYENTLEAVERIKKLK